MAIGINAITKTLERICQNPTTIKDSDQQQSNTLSTMETVFICADQIPPILYSHLPTLSSLANPDVRLVSISTNVRDQIQQALGINKLSAFGLKVL